MYAPNFTSTFVLTPLPSVLQVRHSVSHLQAPGQGHGEPDLHLRILRRNLPLRDNVFGRPLHLPAGHRRGLRLQQGEAQPWGRGHVNKQVKSRCTWLAGRCLGVAQQQQQQQKPRVSSAGCCHHHHRRLRVSRCLPCVTTRCTVTSRS